MIYSFTPKAKKKNNKYFHLNIEADSWKSALEELKQKTDIRFWDIVNIQETWSEK